MNSVFLAPMDHWMAPLIAFWLLLPAFAANPTAVLFGGGTPVDFGRRFKSGTRLLGDGKTWGGTFGGVFCGFLLGLLQLGLALPFDPEGLWGFGPLYPAIIIVLVLPIGSLLGDMIGSFIKRRARRERGAKTPILDQYDFVIGTFLLLVIFFPGWTLDRFVHGWGIVGLATIVTVTPFLHRGVNIIGYKMGKKREPW